MKTLLAGGLAALVFCIGAGDALAAYGPTNCKDPWITQAIYQTWRRMPYANTPVSEECNIMNYNNGSWRTYGELVGYVHARVPQNPPASTGFGPGLYNQVTTRPAVTSVAASQFNSLPQRNIQGVREVQLDGVWYVIASGGGNVIASGGGNLLSTNGGNIISHDAGSLIGHDGASVIASGGGNVIASGGGNITLYKANQ